MAYPSPFLRMVVSGTLFGAERFSWGLSFMGNFTDPAETYPTEVPAGVISAITTFHATANIGSAAKIDMIKLNAIGEDGRYVNDDTVFHEFETPISGTGTAPMPPQVSLALTLLTNKSRGRASRGRFYVPAPALAISADGRITAAAALNFANMGANLIKSLNTAMPEFRVAVFSNVGDGAKSQVQAVTCGRVYDTLRSRRRSLDEDRQLSAVDPIPV